MWRSKHINREAVRFGIVGLASNLVLYLLYLLFTALDAGHKVAMTLIFFVGTLQTFIFNAQWTFKYKGLNKSVFMKYVASYAIAYLTNLIGLMLCVDYLGFSHEIVQGILILLVAGLMFMLQRHWVFRSLDPIVANS